MSSALAVVLVGGVDPFYSDVITTGGVVIVALLGLIGTLAGLGYWRTGKKLDTAVAQTAPTGNGFAEDVRAFMKRTDQLLVNIDTRVTRIEDKS